MKLRLWREDGTQVDSSYLDGYEVVVIGWSPASQDTGRETMLSRHRTYRAGERAARTAYRPSETGVYHVSDVCESRGVR